RDNDAKFRRKLERIIKLIIRNTKRAFVSKEHLKTAATAFDDIAKILFRFRIKPGHPHMKREVACAIPIRFPQPQIKSLHRLLRATRTNHFNETSRAPN